MGVSSGFVRAVWFVLPVASFILLFKLLLCLWCGQLAWFGACPDTCTTCAPSLSAPTGTAVGTSFLAPLCTCLMLDLCTAPPQPAPTQVANDDLCLNLQAAYDLSTEEYDEVMYHILARQNVVHEERASYS